MSKLVSIVNVTPDSFSDGGKFIKPDAAIAAIAEHIEQGADIVDIGAESTRPGATPLSHAEEWERLEPVLAALPHFLDEAVQFSVDTRHAQTAAKALHYGVQWINDVSGFAHPDMIAAVKNSGCKLVVMHSLGVPADKNVTIPDIDDPVEVVLEFARHRITSLERAGITRDRILFDPGIGFGKTASQSLELLRRIAEFNVLGVPLLVGHSRKSCLSQFSMNRDDATLVVSQYLAEKRIDYLRVHEVARHRQMLDVMESLHG